MSRWTGPFVVQEVFSNGSIEISPLDFSRTFKVNGHRLKRYYDGVFVGVIHDMALYDPP